MDARIRTWFNLTCSREDDTEGGHVRIRWTVSMVLVLAACGSFLTVAATTTPAAADDPILVNWPTLLPSFTDQFDPNSANDCTAGRPTCVDITIREMQRRF